MSELTDLLAAEAARQQPLHQPALADLVQVRRRRDRRNRLIVAAAVVLVLATVGTLDLVDRGRSTPSAPPAVTVTGTLLQVGGPLEIPPRGIAGTVRFHATDGTVTSTTTEADGRFSIAVPPGEYIAGGAPQRYGGSIPSRIANDDPSGAATGGPVGAGPAATRTVVEVCEAEAPVTVPAAGLTDVQVICQVR